MLFTLEGGEPVFGTNPKWTPSGILVYQIGINITDNGDLTFVEPPVRRMIISITIRRKPKNIILKSH